MKDTEDVRESYVSEQSERRTMRSKSNTMIIEQIEDEPFTFPAADVFWIIVEVRGILMVISFVCMFF